MNKRQSYMPTLIIMSGSINIEETMIELSNIIFSLEQATICDAKWSRILRKDIQKIKQLRKKGIISSKYNVDK